MVWWLGFGTFHCCGLGLVPGQATEILPHGQEFKR